MYLSKMFHKFKIHSLLNINFLNMKNYYNRQAKGSFTVPFSKLLSRLLNEPYKINLFLTNPISSIHEAVHRDSMMMFKNNIFNMLLHRTTMLVDVLLLVWWEFMPYFVFFKLELKCMSWCIFCRRYYENRHDNIILNYLPYRQRIDLHTNLV